MVPREPWRPVQQRCRPCLVCVSCRLPALPLSFVKTLAGFLASCLHRPRVASARWHAPPGLQAESHIMLSGTVEDGGDSSTAAREAADGGGTPRVAGRTAGRAYRTPAARPLQGLARAPSPLSEEQRHAAVAAAAAVPRPGPRMPASLGGSQQRERQRPASAGGPVRPAKQRRPVSEKRHSAPAWVAWGGWGMWQLVGPAPLDDCLAHACPAPACAASAAQQMDSR